METDFLEKQARLVIKILILVSLLSCTRSASRHVERDLLAMNKNNTLLHQEGNNLYYNNDLFTGALYSIEDDDTLSIELYLNGKEHGLSERWDEQGSKLEERLYRHGMRVGIHKGWFVNGQLKFRYEYKNDFMDGAAEEWFASGKKYRSMHYVSGQEEGLQQMWNEDGTVRANYQARNGRNYGLTGIKNCKNLWKDVKI